MLDAHLRPLIDPPLNRIALGFARAGLRADVITLIGFGLGAACCAALVFQLYGLALILLGLNRIADGLDGAVARRLGPTDAGGFLDIVLDFIFYNGFVVAFAIGAPQVWTPAVILLLTFSGTGSSFLAFAIFAQKHGLDSRKQGPKAFHYMQGLTEGTETILAFVLMCALPQHFALIAGVFAALCAITAATRVIGGYLQLRALEPSAAPDAAAEAPSAPPADTQP